MSTVRSHHITPTKLEFPSGGPRAIPHPSCGRRPPLSGVCSAVLSFRPHCTSGVPGYSLLAGCRDLRVRRLSTNGILPGRVGTGRCGRIFSPTLTGRARLRARVRRDARDTVQVNDTAMETLQARTAVRTRQAAYVFVNAADHPRNARNLLRASIRRCARPGLGGSASMTSGTRSPRGSSKPGLMSIRSRSWAGGKQSRWCCAMRTISRRVCGVVPKFWIVCGEKLAQK